MQSSRAHKQPRNRQLGVTEHPPEHALFVALDFVATDADQAHSSVARLRDVVRDELVGQLADDSTETGELGYGKHRDYELTITVGISTSGYDRLAVAQDQRPIDLQPLPADMIDSSRAGRGPQLVGTSEGHLLLKITADDIFIVEHVLRRIEHELPSDFRVQWVQAGVQRFNTRQSQNPRSESRALIGFLDGTSNLDPSLESDRQLIFTDHNFADYPALPSSDQYNGAVFPPDLRQPPSTPEPAVLNGGTYMTVEVLKQNTEAFDNLPIAAQEQVVGRDKHTGVPVGSSMPTSHVQKANPNRGGDDLKRRVLRRGYSLLRPEASGLVRGLVFVCFGRSLSTQVEFVQRGWMNNSDFPVVNSGRDQLMSQYVDEQIVCGGSYFVPPLARGSQPWSWVVS